MNFLTGIVINDSRNFMMAKELEKNILKLNAIEKIHLIEKLISSLDKPDPEIEKSWIKEAEARFSAYEKGNLKTIPFENVVKDLKRR